MINKNNLLWRKVSFSHLLWIKNKALLQEAIKSRKINFPSMSITHQLNILWTLIAADNLQYKPQIKTLIERIRNKTIF